MQSNSTEMEATKEASEKAKTRRSQRIQLDTEPPDMNGSFNKIQETAVTWHLVRSKEFWQSDEYIFIWDKLTAPLARAAIWRGFQPVIVMPQSGNVIRQDIDHRHGWRRMVFLSGSGFSWNGDIYSLVRYEKLLHSLRENRVIDDRTAVVAVSNDVESSWRFDDCRKFRTIRADYLLTPTLGLATAGNIPNYFQIDKGILEQIPPEITGKTATLSAPGLHGGVPGELPEDPSEE